MVDHVLCVVGDLQGGYVGIVKGQADMSVGIDLDGEIGGYGLCGVVVLLAHGIAGTGVEAVHLGSQVVCLLGGEAVFLLDV